MALTLTRREGESILIGDDIEVIVHKLLGGQVRLKIIAPGRRILRKELLSRPPPKEPSSVEPTT